MRQSIRRVCARARDRGRGYVPANVVFIHFPKCGGNAVRDGLRRRFPASRQAHLSSRTSKRAADRAGRELLELRMALLAHALEEGGRGRLVTGHYPIERAVCDAHKKAWDFVTVLRDPVERWISHYFYNAGAAGPFSVHESLDDFLEGEEAKSWGCLYVRHLTNRGAAHALSDESSIAEACAALDGFAVVGVLERIERFGDRLRDRYGRRFHFRPANAGALSPRERSERVSARQRARIETLCAPDRRVYEHALETLA